MKTKQKQTHFGRRNSRDYVDQMNVRMSTVDVGSVNEEERSVRAVFTTENPVRVWDWKSRQIIEEVLTSDGGTFPKQLPLFDDHYASTSTQLGSGRAITKEQGQHTGTLVFAKNAGEHIDKKWELVRQKHITDVSIGYSYREGDYVDIAPGQSKVVNGRTYTARGTTMRIVTAWRAREISITPIGADEAAKIRKDSANNATANNSRENSQAETNTGGEANTRNLKGKSMNKKLRSLLEKCGLRSEATDAQAWAFYHMIGGQARADADELIKAEAVEVPKERSDSQGEGDGEGDGQQQGARTQRTPPAAPAAAQTNNPAEDPAAIRAAERQRLDFINGFRGEVPDELITRAINENWNEDQAMLRFNAAAVRSLRQQQTPGAAHRSAGGAGDRNVRTLQAAFLLRMGIEPSAEFLRTDLARRTIGGADCDAAWLINGARALGRNGNLTEEADQVFTDAYARRHVSMVDLCRGVLGAQGILHSSWSTEEIIQRAVSTSILTNIFTTAFNADLIQGFVAVPDTSSLITRPVDLPNFQAADRIQMGKYSRLTRRVRGNVPDDGEIDDRKESLRVFEYASKFLIDEQDFIDDRFGALNQVTPREMGEAAAQLQPDLVYGLILSNPTMGDTGALFNATAVTTTGGHANLNTSTALNATNLAARRAAFDVRTLPGTNRLVSVVGSKLLVPSALRYTAMSLVNAQEIRNTNSSTVYPTINPVRGDFTVISEPRLSAGVHYPITNASVSGEPANWYLVDEASRYGIEVAYLSGRGRAPRSRRLPDGQLMGYAMGWSIDHVIGVGAIGFEGIEKNAA